MKPLISNWTITGNISDVKTTDVKVGADKDQDATVFNTRICLDNSYYDNGARVERNVWIGVEAWGKTALLCEKHLRKGDLVTFSGQPKGDSYEDKDKRRVHVVVMVVDEFALRARSKSTRADEKSIEELEAEAITQDAAEQA